MRRIKKGSQDSPHFFWDESLLKEWFDGCKDVLIENQHINQGVMSFCLLSLYCKSLVDTKELRKTILPHLHEVLEHSYPGNSKGFEQKIVFPITALKKELTKEDMAQKVFEGEFLFFIPEFMLAYSIQIPQIPSRQVEEPSTEVTTKGARDGFVEEIGTNIGLIRKRLKTTTLSCEEYLVGTRSKTKVSLLYLKDVIQEDIVAQVRTKLNDIHRDAIVSSTQIEELISSKEFTIFPSLEYTGRPDYATNCLLHGRFLILVEGTPTATIGPVSLPFFINNAEDQHSWAFFASFSRILRMISLVISVFLPGFWISLASYHPDQIPYKLLATLNLAREGVPLPAPLEGFIMISLFELLREAGLRIPSTIGQTLSVVGGLIIGQAAISAGFTSPAIVVMMAISVVCTFTLVNQSLTGALSILRYFVFIFSAFLGVVGLILALFLITIHLVNLRSFGIPFMAPYSPLVPGSVIPATFRVRFRKMTRRPKELHTIDSTRVKDEE